MVVGEHNPRAAVLSGIRDDRAKRECGPSVITLMARNMEATRLVIDMRYPEVLPQRVRIGDTAGEESLRRGKAVELEWEFGTLIAHGRNLWDAGASAHFNRLRNGAVLEGSRNWLLSRLEREDSSL
jgi:hypothetical protein